MSTLIKLRRSAVPGRVPTTAQLELGEIAINTADGKIYIKQEVGGVPSIVEFSASPDDLLNLLKGVDGANSGLDADLLDGLDSTQFLRSDEDDTFDGNLTITGNLTVTGNTTYVNTEEILLSDNVIVLNANFTGATATENAGFEVERGDEPNVVLQWNESQNYWEIASGGTTGRIITTGDEGSGNGFDADQLDGQEGTYYLDFTNFTNLPDPQIDVNVTGKVTGTGTTTLTNLGNGTINIATELANTGVTSGTYGTASLIPSFTVDEDGRITNVTTNTVAGVDSTSWYSANNTFSIETVDGGIYNTVIDTFTDIAVDDLTANSIITQGNVTVNGNIATNDISANNIIVTGLVDGRDIAADGSKLDGIESGATGDMTANEILAALLTVDGSGSGIDADALDGQDSSYYLDFVNFTNLPDPTVGVNLSGKVTGSGNVELTNLTSGNINITTELANTGVVSGTYGTATTIPVITVDEDGRLTAVTTTAVAGVDSTTWYSANNTYQIITGDGSIYNSAISQFDLNVDFGAGIDVTGNVSVTGTVDGRDIAADGLKLDGIESGATADQTPSEILTAIKTVDGVGSGLDADLLDGLNSTQFLRSDVDDTFAGNLTITGDLTVTGNTTYVNTEEILLSDNVIILNANFTGPTASENAGIEVERGGETNVVLQWNETQNYWEIASGGVTGRILTTGDEGSGNGLDADTLDGQQGTYYLDYTNFANTPTASDLLTDIKTVDGTGSGLDADLLDGQQGTYYLDYTNFSNTPTASDLLTDIKTVDGTGSGLDADLLDGQQGSYYLDYANFSNTPTATDLLTDIKTVDGTGSGLDADLLDGQQGSYYLDFTNTTNKPDPQIDVTLSGKVTGVGSTTLTDLSNGSISITTELANTGVVADTYGSALEIPVITVDEDGRITTASTATLQEVAVVTSTTWYSSNNTFNITLSDSSTFDAAISQFDTNVDFGAGIDVTGNVSVTGTVDGRDIAADGAKLDGIESGATADQTASEILSLLLTVDGTGTNLDADLLDGQQGSYYLDYNNFTNTSALLTDILSIDGAGSGIDADTLDGLHASEIAAGAANTAISAIGDGIVTISGSNGLTGSGSFGLNDFSNTSISIQHADTSSQASVNNSNGTVIQDITLDGFGHITSIGSTNLDSRYYTETEIDTNFYTKTNLDGGQLDNRYYTETELNNGQLDNRYYTETEIDANFYTKTDLDGGQLDNRYYTETELNNGALDNRYYTEAEADSRFVNVTGDSVSGNITLTNAADLRFQDTNGTFPTSAGGFQWVLNNDAARIYAQQPSSDQIDFFFKITDNAGSTDRFVFWVDDYRGSTYDKYPAQFDGSAAYLGVPVDGSGNKDLANARFKVPYTGNVTIDGSRIFADNYHPNADKWTTARTVTFAGGDVTGSFSIDGSANVGNVNLTIQPDSVALGTDTTGNYVQSLTQGSGISITGGTGEGSTPTIAHADTSSVTNVSTTGKDVISSITFDTFGHVTARTTRTLDVISQSEADALYVNVDGDTMTGNLDIQATLTVQDNIVQSHAAHATASATTASTTATTIFTFDSSTYNSAEIIITATQGINRHITKLLVVHNGTTSSATEFGTIYTNTSLASYDVGLSGGNVTLNVTPASSTSTTYKIAATLIID